jgi:ApbE superfamily uncharacterized protein (UPF0280 family)
MSCQSDKIALKELNGKMAYPTPIFDRGFFRLRRIMKQSNVLAISDVARAIESGIDSILYHRSQLERYVRRRPLYKLSLDPLQIEESAPEVVKLASLAAEAAQVGPMAAVPGALAELAVRDMISEGASVSLIENGGEIAAASIQPLIVGIYAGSSPVSGRIGFHLGLEDFPIGIATSSATVSHALNFGQADAAVVIANTASLADAAAKAVCNSVVGENLEASVRSGLEKAESIRGVRGALVIRRNYVGTVGKLPRLIKVKGTREELFMASLQELSPEEIALVQSEP